MRIRQVAMVLTIRLSRLLTRCPRPPTRCPRPPIRWVRQVHDFADHSYDLAALGPIWCKIVVVVTTNTTKFYSLKLSHWLPEHCRSFPDRADFQDVSTMLPRLHEPTMPISTIFQIVEIGITRSAQCDLGYSTDVYSPNTIQWRHGCSWHQKLFLP